MVVQVVEQLKRLLITSIFLFALLVCFPILLMAQTTTSVKDLVKSLSQNTLRVETKATPYKLTGDFNGDKVEDVAVIVNLSDTAENVGKVIKIEYPYSFGKDVDSEILALLIIHGKGKGWKFTQKSSVLLLGRNSALIFQKSRLNETGDAIKIKKNKRGKVSLYLITEGADGTINWNGRKYIWTESQP